MFENEIKSRIVAGCPHAALVTLAAFILLLACLALGPGVAAAESGPGVSVWHRLNPNAPGFAPPSHERLACVNGSVFWACRYDQPPEPV